METRVKIKQLADWFRVLAYRQIGGYIGPAPKGRPPTLICVFVRMPIIRPRQLISPAYRKMLSAFHKECPEYGRGDRVHASGVTELSRLAGVTDVLDYGSGAGVLKEKLSSMAPGLHVIEYDPAIEGKDELPPKAGAVACFDVLPCVEPDRLDVVLQHIAGRARVCAYVGVSHMPSFLKMPDGRKTHLTVEPPEWWTARLAQFFDIKKVNCFEAEHTPGFVLLTRYALAPKH